MTTEEILQIINEGRTKQSAVNSQALVVLTSIERRLELQSRQISWLVSALEFHVIKEGMGSPGEFPTQ